MNNYLLSIGDISEPEVIGGKAAGLYRLRRLGLRVPDFVVLTADAYRAAAGVDGLSPQVESALDDAWTMLNGKALAVRSSAVDEDGAGRSFAGQMETVLNVQRREALSEAVKTCWRSLHSERAKAYRAASGLDGTPTAMAVVIQEMVIPDASGVLFTINPVSGDADEMLVNSVWGLGEGLVSGALDADAFVLGRDGALRSHRVAEKREQFVAVAGGTKRIAVQDSLISAPSLSENQLKELVALAIRAEENMGDALDIEFCVSRGELYFVQARPITALMRNDSPRQVWDNSNIVESYPGVTLPLTYSFIRHAYHAVYWQFCQLLGLSQRQIRRHDEVLLNMLGLHRGRVYYNLLNWYRLCSLLPGFRYNKGFMEAMMGLRTPDELPEQPLCFARKYFIELPRLCRAGCRAGWLQTTLDMRIRRFHRGFDAVHARFARKNFDALSPKEAMDCYYELERDVLWKWKAPIINDFSAMIFYGLLKKLTVAWDVDPEGALQNSLISGQGRIESTQVSERLLELAARIRQEKEFSNAFIAVPPAEALEMLRRSPQFCTALQSYFDDYGDRGIAELKLEAIPMKDDPTFCVAMLQGYVRSGTMPRGARDVSIPANVADVALKRLGWKPTPFGLPRRWVYQWVLKNARAAIRNRENQRLARTRAYGLIRRIFRSIGKSLQREGRLALADDIFYLELGEIQEIVKGTDKRKDLRALVATRRAEFDEYRSQPSPPDHFVTRGSIYVEEAQEVEAGATNGDMLTGLGACPGRVEGTAMVLLQPDISACVDGQILVTYQTDPGWVVLFPSIKGLVVERGSMLSHSAIVAREMGIPAAVGVRNAVAAIRTGDRVRLDGATGTVEILSRSS